MTDTHPAAPKRKPGFSDAARAKAQATLAAKRAAASPKPADPGEFASLTAADCCKACGPNGCAISGKSYCAHPRKGGLQGRDMSDPDAIARFGRAKKMLGHLGVEARD